MRKTDATMVGFYSGEMVMSLGIWSLVGVDYDLCVEIRKS